MAKTKQRNVVNLKRFLLPFIKKARTKNRKQVQKAPGLWSQGTLAPILILIDFIINDFFFEKNYLVMALLLLLIFAVLSFEASAQVRGFSFPFFEKKKREEQK
jgi:hypothetical protein